MPEVSEMPEGKKIILAARTADGTAVVAYAGSHYESHPDIHPYADKALSQIDLNSQGMQFNDAGFLAITKNVEGFLGMCNIVERQPGDQLRAVVRAGRPPSIGALNREPTQTDLITVVLKKDKTSGQVELFTAWGGPNAPKEIGDPTLSDDERVQSEAFWSKWVFALKRPDLDAIGVTEPPNEEIPDFYKKFL